tara:strand:+ start:3269 stop:3631 length:363 start_codon:yes stop_codon:yes gene_type:complete
MSDDKVMGCVKWFSSKKGYGFVTIISPDHELTGKDIFLHYSNISVDSNYRKVFPGEYVETKVSQADDGRNVCTDVSGLYGGNLLIQNETYRYKLLPKVDNQSVSENVEDTEDAQVEVDDN